MIAIANSAQAIHTVQLHTGADKPAVVAAIAATTHAHMYLGLRRSLLDFLMEFAMYHNFPAQTACANH